MVELRVQMMVLSGRWSLVAEARRGQQLIASMMAGSALHTCSRVGPRPTINLVGSSGIDSRSVRTTHVRTYIHT